MRASRAEAPPPRQSPNARRPAPAVLGRESWWLLFFSPEERPWRRAKRRNPPPGSLPAVGWKLLVLLAVSPGARSERSSALHSRSDRLHRGDSHGAETRHHGRHHSIDGAERKANQAKQPALAFGLFLY